MSHGDETFESVAGAARISEAEFEQIRALVHESFGIKLSSEKMSLVVGRLQKLLRDRGGISFGEYYRQIVADATGSELSELINRISTNHTFFNREKEHFDHFRTTALPWAIRNAKARGSKDLRVWCAASSTGEEPYMLAMIMREVFGGEFEAWDLGILATDISEKALAVARQGTYSEERAAGLPPDLLRKYFARTREGDYQVSPRLRGDLTYRRFNLMNAVLPFRKPFDVIFCRNVMIYFDGPTKESLVARMAKSTLPGGYLYIGHSETLGRQLGDFRYVMPAVYRKDGAI